MSAADQCWDGNGAYFEERGQAVCRRAAAGGQPAGVRSKTTPVLAPAPASWYPQLIVGEQSLGAVPETCVQQVHMPTFAHADSGVQRRVSIEEIPA